MIIIMFSNDADYGITSINLLSLYSLKPFNFIKWKQQKQIRRGKEN